MINKNVNYSYDDFEARNGELYYYDEKIDNIEQFIDEVESKVLEDFKYFLLSYERRIEEYNKTKNKVKDILNINGVVNSWEKIKDLRTKKANEIKEKTVDTLKKLDEKLRKFGNWNSVNIATVEFYDCGKEDGRYDESIDLIWDKERGYYFQAYQRWYDDKVGHCRWFKEDYLDNLDYSKYKDLKIENITNKTAKNIAKELPSRLNELEIELKNDVTEKDKILDSLRKLKIL